MNIKLIRVMGCLFVHGILLGFAPQEPRDIQSYEQQETLAQKIARRSQENRAAESLVVKNLSISERNKIEENMVVFEQWCQKLKIKK